MSMPLSTDPGPSVRNRYDQCSLYVSLSHISALGQTAKYCGSERVCGCLDDPCERKPKYLRLSDKRSSDSSFRVVMEVYEVNSLQM